MRSSRSRKRGKKLFVVPQNDAEAVGITDMLEANGEPQSLFSVILTNVLILV